MVKISQLPQDTAPTDDDKLPLVDTSSSTTKYARRDDFLKGNPIIDPLIQGSADGELFKGRYSGWVDPGITFSVATGYNQGNKEFLLTPSADPTAYLSPGMRMRFTRNTAPPTQCTDLEASSSQYASRVSGSVTGISFTDDFTVEAWVKLESFPTANYRIISRYSTGPDDGFLLSVVAPGVVELYAAGTGNRTVRSLQSVPLGRWVHIAVSLDMSAGAIAVYIDGAAVTSSLGGTATALTQAGDLSIGNSTGASDYFDGKVADVRIWNVVRTPTQIRDNMNQQLVGNETNLVGYWKLNGNFNDSTSNANNLTASGGAAATNADNPMNTTEYGIITKVTASAVTLFTGTDYNIPNMTLNNPYYSVHAAPFGFPTAKNKWRVITLVRTSLGQSSPVSGTWYTTLYAITVPIGEWELSHQCSFGGYKTTDVLIDTFVTLSTGVSSETDQDLSAYSQTEGVNGIQALRSNYYRRKGLSLAADTTYYVNLKTDRGSMNAIEILAGSSNLLIEAECAYT